MAITACGKNMHLRAFLAFTLAIIVSACSDKEDPGPSPVEGNLVSATATGAMAATQLQVFIQFSGRDIDPELFRYDVDIYKVVYKTTYRNSEVNASGVVLLPKTTTSVPMISFQHGTIVRQSDAPSAQSATSAEMISYSALASMGFITAVPDYIGFGASKDIFHPYYVEEPSADAVRDLLTAAALLAGEKQVAFNSRLFLAGYSQGGYTTMATHKDLEADASSGFDLIASFAGAGGYDIKAFQEYLFALETYPDPYYLAYVGMSYQSHYDESVISSFFKEPYATKIPSLFDGIKSSGDIDAQLTEVVADLVRDDLRTSIDTNPAFSFIRERLEENSLVDWKPSAQLFLYHGDADVTVPLENSEVTYNKLLSNGGSTEVVQLIVFPGKDHSSAIDPFIEDVVQKLQTLNP